MLENKNTLLFGSYQHTFTLRDISAWFNNGPTHIHVPGRAITKFRYIVKNSRRRRKSAKGRKKAPFDSSPFSHRMINAFLLSFNRLRGRLFSLHVCS